MEIGQVCFEKYRILEKIGKGGTSDVYLAENIRIGNKWAIKKAYKDRNHIKTNLLAEPKILKDLNHEAIPKIIDIEEDEEAIYIIEEYVYGKNLKQYRMDNEIIEEDVIVDWAIQICDILNYLHTQKPHPIIYRDLKPENIIISKEGKVRLVDFGIARIYKEEQSNDTVQIGTRGYAAPEQYGIGQSDEKTDIYSLGVTLYYLLTNKNLSHPPYKIQSVKQFNPQVSLQLENIILKCCEILPQNRYQNVIELKSDLELHYKNKQLGSFEIDITEPNQNNDYEFDYYTERDSNVNFQEDYKVYPKTNLKEEASIDSKTDFKEDPRIYPKTDFKKDPRIDPKTNLQEEQIDPKTNFKIIPKLGSKIDFKLEPKTELKKEAKRDNISYQITSNKTVTIGIIGTSPCVGVTHTSILLAKFLSNKNKVSIIEMNESNALKYISPIEENQVYFKYKRIHFFPKVDYYQFLYQYKEQFNYVILDFGSYTNLVEFDEFLRCDVRLVIGHGIDWKIKEVKEFYESTQQYDPNHNWIYLIPFLEKKYCRELNQIIKNKFYTLPFNMNPFSPTQEIKNIFEKIIR